MKNYPAVDLWTLYPNAFSRIDLRTFVLEFLGRDINDAPEIESMIYKTLLAMRLYKPISVFCKIVWFEENLEEYYAISATLKFFTGKKPISKRLSKKRSQTEPQTHHIEFQQNFPFEFQNRGSSNSLSSLEGAIYRSNENQSYCIIANSFCMEKRVLLAKTNQFPKQQVA